MEEGRKHNVYFLGNLSNVWKFKNKNTALQQIECCTGTKKRTFFFLLVEITGFHCIYLCELALWVVVFFPLKAIAKYFYIFITFRQMNLV